MFRTRSTKDWITSCELKSNAVHQLFIYRDFQELYLSQRDDSYLTLIPRGKTEFHLDESELNHHIGLFNFSEEPTKIRTKGLKWDIDDRLDLRWRKFQSSSNRLKELKVEIETDRDLLWVSNSEK